VTESQQLGAKCLVLAGLPLLRAASEKLHRNRLVLSGQPCRNLAHPTHPGWGYGSLSGRFLELQPPSTWDVFTPRGSCGMAGELI